MSFNICFFKCCLFVIFSSLLAACAISDTERQGLPTSSLPGNKLSILDHEGFTQFKKILSLIVKDRSTQATTAQHFYISDYQIGEQLSYMLWREERQLWIVQLGDKTEESWLGLRYQVEVS